MLFICEQKFLVQCKDTGKDYMIDVAVLNFIEEFFCIKKRCIDQ